MVVGLILVVYSTIITVIYFGHDCPAVTESEISEEYVEKVKEISNAETKDDVDSLLLELYGFSSD